MIEERLKVLLLDENASSLFGDQIRYLNDSLVATNVTTFVMIQFMKRLVEIFIHVRLKPHFARYRNKLLKTYNYLLTLRKTLFPIDRFLTIFVEDIFIYCATTTHFKFRNEKLENQKRKYNRKEHSFKHNSKVYIEKRKR